MRRDHILLQLTALIAFSSVHGFGEPVATFTSHQAGTGMQSTGTMFSTIFSATGADPAFQPGQSLITRGLLSLKFTGSSDATLKNSSPITVSERQDVTGIVKLTEQTLIYDDMVDSVNINIGAGAQTAVADDYGPPPYSPYYETNTVVTQLTTRVTVPIFEVTFVCDIPDPSANLGCYRGHSELVVHYVSQYVVYEEDTKHNIVSGYKGPFSIDIPLNTAALRAFSTTGILPVGYEVRAGAASLDSADLSFDVAPVPEPSAGLFTAAGALIVLAAHRFRRKGGRPPAGAQS